MTPRLEAETVDILNMPGHFGASLATGTVVSLCVLGFVALPAGGEPLSTRLSTRAEPPFRARRDAALGISCCPYALGACSAGAVHATASPNVLRQTCIVGSPGRDDCGEDRAGTVRLGRRLRGGGTSEEGRSEEQEADSGELREAAMLADMGFEPVKDGEELEKLDPDGRKYTPEARTIPGELCSEDDLSNPSEQEYAHESQESDASEPSQRAAVKIKYYDLAAGATHNISNAFPEEPAISGIWQLALRVHSREYTFCAHRGVITYNPRHSAYGQAMCVRGAGSTALRDDEVVHALRTLHHRFNPLTFDPYNCTSIDFCQQLAFILTGKSRGIPRTIKTKILLQPASDDETTTWGDVSRHWRSVCVTHLPEQLDPEIGESLGDMFRKWGQVTSQFQVSSPLNL